MRHRKAGRQLRRTSEQRLALLRNLATSLIEHKQIKTTLAKAKAVRPFAEKLVTLGKRGDLHARRTALSYLHHKNVVKELFDRIAPAASGRQGGYTRITKLGQRQTDSAPMAFIEWVDQTAVADAAPAAEPATAAEPAPKKKAAAKKPAAKKAKAPAAAAAE